MLSTNPDGPQHWIKVNLIDGGGANVHYSSEKDNEYNPDDYKDTLSRLTGVLKDRLVEGLWALASGLIYDVWSDGSVGGNVANEADYMPGGGIVYWAIDDGYSGKLDPKSGSFTAASHPRAFLLCQLRHDGTLCVFDESYAVKTLEDRHIERVLALGYEWPEFAGLDKSAAQLRGRLLEKDIDVRRGPGDVEESIKEVRRRLAADENGKRMILVHPRCFHFRKEMVSYVRDKATGKPVKEFDHGPDALRYLVWNLRYE